MKPGKEIDNGTDLKLKYSVETLYHFACGCGGIWTISGQLPEFVTCPKCRIEYIEFEDITQKLNYCKLHKIWYHTDTCPMDRKDGELRIVEL